MKENKNLQPQGSERYFIAEIIGHKNLMKLDRAGYKVRHRNKILQKQITIGVKLKQYKETILTLSTLLGQSAVQHSPAHPNHQNPSDM
jgi:hypothetical protein